jgi:hypothetical protein
MFKDPRQLPLLHSPTLQAHVGLRLASRHRMCYETLRRFELLSLIPTPFRSQSMRISLGLVAIVRFGQDTSVLIWDTTPSSGTNGIIMIHVIPRDNRVR